jgi:hypothetical protein
VKVFAAVVGVAPPSHEYVPTPDAVTLIDDVAQDNTVVPVLLAMDAIGAVLFPVIVILAVAVHPFAPVTVTI